MSDTIIRVENLGKKFAIARQVEREAVRATLRDALTEGTKSLARKLRRSGIGTRAKREEFWALKDVSFEVNRGECVGIIGRNGAGKSTLLKILSRITEPTTGRIELRGRVASLLEVGTGFHAELTGRENIYLNGAILGMTRAEIRKKFDEIVAFAEVEKFLDTPVKHYSSGMYVRLAFAVAAHLDPEILIVDEVLAVGDAAFQKKCLEKMQQVSQGEGQTILFVSHNLAAVQSLCSSAIILTCGQLVEQNKNVGQVIERYLQGDREEALATDRQWPSLDTAPGNDRIKLLGLRAVADTDDRAAAMDINTPIRLEITYYSFCDVASFYFGSHIITQAGEIAFITASEPQRLEAGFHKSICYIPPHLLNNRRYTTHLYWVKDGNQVLYDARDLLTFEVLDAERKIGSWMGDYLGPVRPRLKWTTERIGAYTTLR